MTIYIADNLNIIFQKTKNILLQDIINITFFMLKVNVGRASWTTLELRLWRLEKFIYLI